MSRMESSLRFRGKAGIGRMQDGCSIQVSCAGRASEYSAASEENG